ncbi:MAG: response regulator [Candidatus Poribacteria bacterium]|nr:response regulator [Candidatus Poribacteria bacterium]
MSEIKILFVEDAKDQQDIFKDIVAVFNADEHNINVTYEIAETTEEASSKLDSSYDGAIIDLWLDGDEEGGNEIVHQLDDSFTRIPIIFVTAFADKVIDHPSIVKTRRREDGTYRSDLLLFQEIHNTGLTRIMGGRGIIEENLSKVFLESLLPQIQTWVSYRAENSERSERTERSLLRYALNHLFQLLEEDSEDYFPEEVYLYPPIPDRITTGSMVKEDSQWFVVLSPACDLVTRGGGQFTERILFVEVEKETDIVDKALNRLRRIIDEVEKENVKKDILQRLAGNNYTFYYHWLPPVKFKISDDESLDFDGGFLNFRKLEALPKRKFTARFKEPLIQISPFFVKDIVSRFSSYYARQGQPDIDSEDFVIRYTT